MQRLEFLVEGSKGDEYRIIFERYGDNLNAYCSCPAGDSGTYCKHRFALMDGVAEDLIGGNENDVHKLKNLMAGTDLEKIYREVVNIQAEYDKISERLKRAKKRIGTGHAWVGRKSPGIYNLPGCFRLRTYSIFSLLNNYICHARLCAGIW